MGTNQTDISAVATRNIKIGLVDSGLTKRTLALKAGISSTTFDRKLSTRPETFTIQELGKIAQALNLELPDLFRDAA